MVAEGGGGGGGGRVVGACVGEVVGRGWEDVLELAVLLGPGAGVTFLAGCWVWA